MHPSDTATVVEAYRPTTASLTSIALRAPYKLRYNYGPKPAEGQISDAHCAHCDVMLGWKTDWCPYPDELDGRIHLHSSKLHKSIDTCLDLVQVLMCRLVCHQFSKALSAVHAGSAAYGMRILVQAPSNSKKIPNPDAEDKIYEALTQEVCVISHTTLNPLLLLGHS